jgi:hypothetical protein
MSDPKPIAALLGEGLDPDAISVKMTGKTVAQWEAEWKGRRIEHVRNRRLNGSTIYSVAEREAAIRFYDLSDGDFEPVIAATGIGPTKEPPDMRTWPVVQLDGRRAEREIEDHETGAQIKGRALLAVTYYRLRQDALRRIAAEAREMHVRAGEADLF